MADLATASESLALADALVADLERRRPRLAQVMTRAIITEVRWDSSTGVPPATAAIRRACEAGLDLFLATARDGRPPTQEELRKVSQLGILTARSGQSVEPVLAAYRVAARVAWQAILQAWRKHPDATPETMVRVANHVFTAMDQVAAEVTRTYLVSKEQHLERGTRARGRLFHALVSDTFDSEIAVQKQALALSIPLASTYVALVLRVVAGKGESQRGAEELTRALAAQDLPPAALVHSTDALTVAVLWPAETPAATARAADVVAEIDSQLTRTGSRVRGGVGGHHGGLRGISRSYVEALQALDVGRRVRPGAALHRYDELLPYLLLAQQPLLAERYVASCLGPLLATPRPQLVDTLEAYLNEGSVKGAATALDLHRHTVLYRLDKVRQLLGADPDQPATRQKLQLALDLRRLLPI